MEELGIDEETDVFDPEDDPIPKIKITSSTNGTES